MNYTRSVYSHAAHRGAYLGSRGPLNRRQFLGALASSVAALGGCGGGGGTESQSSQGPSSSAETFLGDPAGRFTATPDRTALTGLKRFTIVTDATTRPYDYMAVVYALNDREYYVDYPPEPTPGQLEVTAPVGLLRSGDALGYGNVQLAVVRIAGDIEEISNVTSMRLEPPPLPSLPSVALAGALFAATGALRSRTLESAWRGVQQDPDLASLERTNTLLYSSRTVAALGPLLASAAEERVLRQYLGAIFETLELNPSEYISQNRLRPASVLQTKIALDGLEGFDVDLERMVRDLGDKVRSNGKVLQRVGGLIGTAGAVALVGGASPAIATAAVGVGATMAMVGFTTGLVEGFLLDNAATFAGLPGTSKLDFRPTLRYWYDSASSYFLKEAVNRYVPKAGDFAGGALRERIGAFVYEVSRSEILTDIRGAVEAAVERGTSVELPSVINNVRQSVSAQWFSWSANRFSDSTFPSSTYRSVWSGGTNQPGPGVPNRCPNGGYGTYCVYQ